MNETPVVYHVVLPSLNYLLLWSILVPALIFLGYLALFYLMLRDRHNPRKLMDYTLIFLGGLFLTYILRVYFKSLILQQMLLASMTQNDYLGTVTEALSFSLYLWDMLIIGNVFPVMLIPFIIIFIFILATRKSLKRIRRW